MKFKKIVSTVIATLMMTSILANMPNAVKEAKAAADYSYLDQQAYSGNDLGAIYSPSKTSFKVWAPTATSVKLKLYTTGSDSEAGARVISTDNMTKGSNGTWSIEKTGDLKNVYYTYLVTNNGIEKETVDLYAKAAGVNGNRGMVIDLDSTDPAGWSSDSYIQCENQTDAIVWEGHVRDFSIDSNSGMTNKGKFLAFTEKGTTLNSNGKNPTGISYLKELGITHVQLLPIYDYATVDETKLNTDQFNWGYDPKNYNVPEGSYSTNPYDGNVRVNELKQMVKSLHSEDIGVIMDVVYNHTYDENKNDSWFNRTVPGYYYRHDNKGFANGSGCGNETASERAMYQKYMIDSLKYWMTEYHIDGFRFDLMGLHDTDTMNLIKKELEKINPNVVIYGEPWNAGSTASSKPTAVQGNMSLVDAEVGAFNDKVRDAIKGSCFSATGKGFIQGAAGFEESLKAGIQANSTTMAGTNKWSKQPSQTVTYTSAHDNFTLYDKLVMSCRGGNGYDNYYEDLADMNKMAGGIILTSQGISFMQAGEEFGRTKFGDENSYKSSSSINKIDWSKTVSFKDVADYYKGLIQIRKAYTPFRDPTNTSNAGIYFSWGTNCPSNVVAFTIQNKITSSTEWNYVGVIHNANSNSVTVNLQGYSTLPGQWVVIADGDKAGVEAIKTISGTSVQVPGRSTMVLVDKDSYERVSLKKGSVLVKYVDQETGKEISPSKSIEGVVGSKYTTSAVTIEGYDLAKTPSNASGSYIDGNQVVTYEYIKDTTPRGSLTVKYVDKATGTEIAASTNTTGKEGSNYTTSAITIKGYELDQTSLPNNANGKYTAGNTVVTYYYNKKEVKNVKVHYYNANKWSTVNIYAYDETSGTAIKLSGNWPGTKMTDEGNGWFSYEVDDATYAQIIFNNGSSQEPAAKEPGYKVEGEVWIKDKTISTVNPNAGTIIVKYIDGETGEEVATPKSITGSIGDPYNTSAVSIAGYVLSETPPNANGTIKSGTTTIIYKYTKEIINKELIITSNDTSVSSPQAVGKSITLTTNTTGGEGTVKYRFVALKNGKSMFAQSYSTNNIATWIPKESGTYTLYFKAIDDTKVEKCKTITYVITGDTLSIKSSTTSVQSPQNAFTNIKLTTEVNGGEGTVKYRFVAIKNGKTTFAQSYSTKNTTTWTPKEAGTYTLYFKAIDDTKIEQCKTITYVVKSSSLTLASYKVNVISPQVLGSSINLSITASGGNGAVQYRFVAMKNGKIKTFAQGYSTKNLTTWTPTEAGTYKLHFKIKDNSGKEIEKIIDYVIK